MDPGEGPGGPAPPPPLVLDQTEAQRAEKNFLETPFPAPPPPPPLSKGLDDRAPTYLKVWIQHWLVPIWENVILCPSLQIK